MTTPIAQVLARSIVPMITSRATRESGRSMEDTDVSKLEREIASAIEANSELKNMTNQEAPYQSRVAWGATLAALGVIIPTIARVFGVDIAEEEIVRILEALWTLGWSIYALFGRFGTFAAPLFERRSI